VNNYTTYKIWVELPTWMGHKHLPYPVLCEINLSWFWSSFLDNERKVSRPPFQVERLAPPVYSENIKEFVCNQSMIMI
jgi:hypothetical protein